MKDLNITKDNTETELSKFWRNLIVVCTSLVQNMKNKKKKEISDLIKDNEKLSWKPETSDRF